MAPAMVSPLKDQSMSSQQKSRIPIRKASATILVKAKVEDTMTSLPTIKYVSKRDQNNLLLMKIENEVLMQ